MEKRWLEASSEVFEKPTAGFISKGFVLRVEAMKKRRKDIEIDRSKRFDSMRDLM